MGILFQNTYVKLPGHFYSRERPAGAENPGLICVNDGLAAELGISEEWLDGVEAVEVFSGNKIPDGAEPISQAYAGHQFGGFVPRLGDGRAILLGEVIDQDGQRKDIQLKGAGRTEFSRGGDGKSALGPVLREYLVSEAMHAYGVPTTRALAAVITGEKIQREEEVPGGIFTRVAASHIRVGTFQFFVAQKDTEALRMLLEYTIARHFPQCEEAENPALVFLQCVVEAQAKLIAKWLPLGFIHGVMNTDNCSISGETIDYGPCAFMDTFHPDCVFSYIDRNARYAWANQPVMAHWNLTRLAETLLPLIDESPEKSKELARGVLDQFITIFQPLYLEAFRKKLGLSLKDSLEESAIFIKSTLGILAKHKVDFTLFFRCLTRYAAGDSREELDSLFSDSGALDSWLADWQKLPAAANQLELMQQANPIRIPRNHRIEQVIQAAYQGDFSLFHELCKALKNPFEEDHAFTHLEAAPLADEVVQNTFCGT